ncbi:ATP-dependent RNA helicase DDX24 [Anopheles bellator]|uniref:ATP-dependent RNA helicase DDX24 n=1 Tax=Anopheles bellator TaxID=139047 RepID=UPI0026492DAE|nr:ATP-dependent RNA helicase DDX24 [Anopheles bellator]
MQKHRKFKPKRIPRKSNGPNTVKEGTWESVKINGAVISDEGADLGGFIGLEVMENYGNNFLRKPKQKDDNDESFDGGKKKPKRKRANDSDESDDSDDERNRKVCQKKQKATKPAVRHNEEFSDSDSQLNTQKGNLKTKQSKALKDEADKKQKQAIIGVKKMKLKVESLGESTKLANPPTSEAVQNKIVPAVDGLNNKPGFSMLLKPPKKSQKQLKKKQTEQTRPNNASKTTYSSVEYMQWIELGVSEPIVKALAEKGFKTPTEIQEKSLPAAIFGRRDLLGAAETGSGKTLAFGIPMLEGIRKLKQMNQPSSDNTVSGNDEHELTPPPEEFELTGDDEQIFAQEGKQAPPVDSNKPLYGLILTPTRELAVQINDHLKSISKYTAINIALVFGGMAVVKQERMLRKCPEIVIATPGRLWELIQSGNQHLSKVMHIRFLVIDETDRMLEKGHFEELKQLLELINTNEDAKKKRRNYIFSATLTMDHELPEHLQKNPKKSKKVLKETPGQRLNKLIETIGMTNPKVVDLTQEHGTAHTLTESRILCQSIHKDFYLYYFVQRHPGRTLVFCNSIGCVRRLVALFTYLNCQPLSLFGSMQQRQRLKNLERFTDNSKALLIATDVAARGLDIPNVDHVIHYQVPKTTENYVHRSGRTARASKEGLTVLLIAPEEVKDYVKLNQDLGRTEDLPLYPTSDRMMRQIRQRVQLAREIERMEMQQRRAGEERSWEDTLAKEFKSDSEVDSEQEEMRKLEQGRQKRKFKAKRMELSHLLAMPLAVDRTEMRYPTTTAGMRLAAEGEQSAISLVQQAVQQRKEEKKQRNNKRKETQMG